MGKSKVKPKSYHHGNLVESFLDVAVKLIAERGQPEFTLREIAVKLGVSHPAVYRHFKSKHDVLAALATRGYQNLSIEFAALPGAKETSETTCRNLLISQSETYVAFACKNPGFFRSMFHPHLRITSEAAELQQAANEALHHLKEAASAFLQTKKKNRLNQETINKVTALFWANVHGLATLTIDGLLNGPLLIDSSSACAMARFQATTFLDGVSKN